MFSRIFVVLAKFDAVTLEDFVKVIRDVYKLSFIVCIVENIYDVKFWFRFYVVILKYYLNLYVLRFKLNENGEVEMFYRFWAKLVRKEWLSEEGFIVVL